MKEVYKGGRKTVETITEREMRAVARQHTLNRYAQEPDGGKRVRWYAYVRSESNRYWVGRTIRHPSIDVILPSVLVECVACTNYVDVMRKGKQLHKRYTAKYGPVCQYERRFISAKTKDLLLEQPLPTYSYDEAMVRQV